MPLCHVTSYQSSFKKAPLGRAKLKLGPVGNHGADKFPPPLYYVTSYQAPFENVPSREEDVES